MELREYLRFLRKYWAPISAATLLGLIVAIVCTIVDVPTYKSTAVIYVSVQPDGDPTAGELIQGERLSRQLINSYVLMVGTARVLDPVVDDLGLRMSSADLAERVSASSPAGTALMSVSATDRDSEIAANLANAVAEKFLRTAKQIEQPQGGAASVINADILQPAESTDSPVSPVFWKNALLGLALGLAAGVIIAALWTWLIQWRRGLAQ